MSDSEWPWFELPLRPGAQDEMFTLFEWHRERRFLKFNTPVPKHPSVHVVQVLTFTNGSGYQAVFTESVQRQFERLASEFQESLRPDQRAELQEVVVEARIAAHVYGAGEEELFVVCPAACAGDLVRKVDSLVENSASTFCPPDGQGGG